MPIQKYYPYIIQPNTYGYNLYWIEEFWAFSKFQQLKQTFPKLSFNGLIDESFISRMSPIFLRHPYDQLPRINSFMNLDNTFCSFNRKFINLASSHAPSRYIAESYFIKHKKKLAIISFDAHFDLETRGIFNNAWITKKLASSVILIGGWAETKSDLVIASNLFPFIFENLDEILTTSKFMSWIQNKQIYVTIDLDFFPISQHNYLGYSNYWHREYLIGHANTFLQLLSSLFMNGKIFNQSKNISPQSLVGEILEFFPSLKKFHDLKLRSLEKQSIDLVNLLKTLNRIIQECSANLLSIDLVEYSPICDWNQLTIKKLIEGYSQIIAIFKNRGE